MHKLKKKTFNMLSRLANPLKGRDLNRFRLVRGILNILLLKFKPEFVIIDGDIILLDKYDSLRLSILGVYEPFMSKLFNEKVKKNTIVIDIGAHIGYYTCKAAKLVGSKGKVYAFEPEKNNFSLLSENVKNNRYNNVVLVNKAVGDSIKKAKLFLCSINVAHHSLVENGGTEGELVDVISLDSFFTKTPRVSVVKMDIEGGEYAALKGMVKILRRNDDVAIFVEFSPMALRRSGISPLNFVNFLRELKFRLYHIDEKHKELKAFDFNHMMSLYPSNRDWHVNLLVIK